MQYIYRLNTKIRLTMLCLGGFELYSRWVPLLFEDKMNNIINIINFDFRDTFHYFCVYVSVFFLERFRVALTAKLKREISVGKFSK